MAKSMSPSFDLTASQVAAFEGIKHALTLTHVVELRASDGRGRTTVLRALHAHFGGHFLTLAEFLAEAVQRHPLSLEDALYELLSTAVKEHSYLFVDDLHVATEALRGCHFYPRSGYLQAPLKDVCDQAARLGHKLILADNGTALHLELHAGCWSFSIDDPTADDYRQLAETFLPPRNTAEVDFQKVHRFAPRLTARQIRDACTWNADEPLNTEAMIEYLRSQQLTSNVELSEVAPVTLRDLHGIDDIVQSLEANIVLPLENDELAQELDLRPKRGVLLAGPPGTGKTTVGRALAHRLRGKFFLIDGTVISGTEHFYGTVHQIFQAARENAPSIIFIDDSDVIFESGDEHGLYRYLLTMLDGLESKSAGRVCVMMTAMDVGNLPPAIIRSGRVELWLEMRLPNESSRLTILAELCRKQPGVFQALNLAELAVATEGFTGADLKRVVEDGKALYAYDRVTQSALRPITEYFLRAATEVRSNAERYAKAAEVAWSKRCERPAWFGVGE